MQGLNLTKLESRPVKNGEFEYAFYLDFEGNLGRAATVDLLCCLIGRHAGLYIFRELPGTVRPPAMTVLVRWRRWPVSWVFLKSEDWLKIRRRSR